MKNVQETQDQEETLQEFKESGLGSLSEAFKTAIDKYYKALVVNRRLLFFIAALCIVPISFVFNAGLNQLSNMDALPEKVLTVLYNDKNFLAILEEDKLVRGENTTDIAVKIFSNRISRNIENISEKINSQVSEKQNRDLWLYLNRTLMILPIEILLIYFFRLVFNSYRLALSQRTQLIQRQTLSVFIHKWSEHKENFKKHDFNPFERVVFSELISDITDTPNALDLDAISKLIPNITGK